MLLPILLGGGALSGIALVLYFRTRKVDDLVTQPAYTDSASFHINVARPSSPAYRSAIRAYSTNQPSSRYAEPESDTSPGLDPLEVMGLVMVAEALTDNTDYGAALTPVDDQPYVAPSEPAYSAPEPCSAPEPSYTSDTYSQPDTSFSCDTSSPSFD